MAADVATLGIKVDASGAITQLGAVEGAVGSLKAAFISMAGILGLGLGLREIVTASVDAQRSFAQLEAGVRSTGMAAGFTATQLHEQAMAMQELTSFSHDAIEKTQSIFLLFQDLKGVQFQQATQAAADLAARMGTDVPDAARQLGKALEAPATGLLMLRRAGIVFTDQQTEQIKTMAKAGDLLGAQTIILDLLTQKVGGSAAALRGTLGGALSNLKNQLVDFIKVSKDGSSGTIAFINTIADGVKHLDDYKASIMGIAAALAMPAIASGVTALVASMTGLNIVAQLSMAFFMTGIPGAFAAAGLAGTGLTGVMIGLSGAMMPLMVTLGAFAVLLGMSVYIIEKQTKANDDLIDANDRLSASTSKNFQDGNVHIQTLLLLGKMLQDDAAATAKVTAANVAAAKAEQDKIAEIQKSIAQSVETAVWDAKHIDLLNKQAAATAFTTEVEAGRTAGLKAMSDAMDVLAKKSELMESGIATTPLGATGNASIPIQTGMSGNFAQQSDAIITAGVTKRANVAHAAANALDAAFRDNQYAAWTKYYEDLAKEEENIQKTAIKDIQRLLSSTLEGVFTGAIDSAGKLWDALIKGAEQTAAKFASMKIMQGFTEGSDNGGGVSGGVSGALGSLGATAFVGTVLAIGDSISQTSAMNKKAAADFANSIITWQASFNTLAGIGNQNPLNSQFQTLMNAAIQAAITAIQGSPAARYGASGVGAFGATTGTVPVAGTIQDLDAYIAQLQKAQGTGKNVAQDRDLAVLLTQLEALDAEYKKQTAAAQAVFNSNLQVRLLTAEGNTAAASALALQIAQQKEYADAVLAGYDAATLAQLKYVQGIEAVTAAANAASGAALNMVAGYKLQATIFGAMAAHGGGSSGPYTPPTSQPYTPSSPTGATGTSGGDLTVNVVMADGTVLGKAVLKSFKAIAQRQSGDSSKWSLIQ
jgi:hypothetical protein